VEDKKLRNKKMRLNAFKKLNKNKKGKNSAESILIQR